MRTYHKYTVDTGTNFGGHDIFAKSELHAFRTFVDMHGNHFNKTLTIEKVREPRLDFDFDNNGVIKFK